ncbi:hypothetical protein IC582_003625 [Cucumis melo]
MLLILEALLHDNKRITHIPVNTRHRIRQLTYFRMIHSSDLVCWESTRMDRRCFLILCHLLRTRADLESTEHVDVEEMVALFLHVLAHDVKNRQIQREFVRSSEIVPQHFNMVLMAVLRLHDELLATPQPITSGCIDMRWHCFEVRRKELTVSLTNFSKLCKIRNCVPYLLQNCIGALDDMYIKVNVSAVDRPRYRTRKGEVATNFLGVCDTKGDFVFILAGWEGSAANSRNLRDALSRPNGLKVLKVPYKGQRYHLQEWRGTGNAPETPKEFFNMKHSSAWNVIERASGLLKGCWAILREKSYYPVEVQCPTIMACCLLHNLINREITYINELDDEDDGDSTHATTSGDDITYIEPSNEWTEWRDALASSMFTEWQLRNQ